MQQEKLMETPLYSYGNDFQIIAADRDTDANVEGATNDIDFVIIRRDITASDAMEVLDLLLTCIVNETLDEINQTVPVEYMLYTYISTKINATNAVKMNLPFDVLKFIPLYNMHVNSPQGGKPSKEEDVSWNLSWDILKPVANLADNGVSWEGIVDLALMLTCAPLLFALYDDLMLLNELLPSLAKLMIFIIAVITFVVMAVLTWLLNSGLLWAIIRLILLIMIFLMLAIEIYTTIPIYLAIGLSLLALASVAGVNSDVGV